MFFNRRRHQRKVVEKYCDVSSSSGRFSFICKVTNISESGMGIDIEEKIESLLQVNSEVVVHLDDDTFGSSIKNAVVVWLMEKPDHKPGATAGLEFI